MHARKKTTHPHISINTCNEILIVAQIKIDYWKHKRKATGPRAQFQRINELKTLKAQTSMKVNILSPHTHTSPQPHEFIKEQEVTCRK